MCRIVEDAKESGGGTVGRDTISGSRVTERPTPVFRVTAHFKKKYTRQERVRERGGERRVFGVVYIVDSESHLAKKQQNTG